MSQIRVDEITDEVGTGSPAFPNGTPGFPLTSSDMPAGSVIQVVSTTKTNTFSTVSTTYVDVPNLSLVVEPLSANNKFLVFGNVYIRGKAGTTSQRATAIIQLVRDSSPIHVGDSNGVTGFNGFENSNDSGLKPQGFTFFDEPNTLSNVTYKMQIKVNQIAGNFPALVNDGNFNTASTITVMEIAG